MGEREWEFEEPTKEPPGFDDWFGSQTLQAGN